MSNFQLPPGHVMPSQPIPLVSFGLVACITWNPTEKVFRVGLPARSPVTTTLQDRMPPLSIAEKIDFGPEPQVSWSQLLLSLAELTDQLKMGLVQNLNLALQEMMEDVFQNGFIVTQAQIDEAVRQVMSPPEPTDLNAYRESKAGQS